MRRFSPRTAQPGEGLVSQWGQQGIIEYIERGNSTIASGTTLAVTLGRAVDPNRTLLKYLGNNNNGVDQNDVGWARLELNADGTQLSLIRAYSGSTYTTLVSWEVICFYPGVLRSVQRSTVTMSAGVVDWTLSPSVDPRRASADWLGMEYNSLGSGVTYTKPTVELLSTGATVRASVGGAGSQVVGLQVGWFN